MTEVLLIQESDRLFHFSTTLLLSKYTSWILILVILK